jgi:septal ring-binding cell division protein DamX
VTYHFSFNTKMLVLLLAGCGAVGLLLFVAGVLVGIVIDAPQTPHLAHKPTGKTGTGAQPVAPPVAPSQTRTHTLVPSAVAQPVHQPEVPLPVSQHEHKVQRDAPQEEVSHGSAVDTESPTGTTAVAESTVMPRQPLPAQRLLGAESRALSRRRFTVQLGAFLVSQNAAGLLAELRHKGYTPCIVPLQDKQQRRWYTVRMGSYATRREALRAAARFSAQENSVTLVVRRLPEADERRFCL